MLGIEGPVKNGFALAYWVGAALGITLFWNGLLVGYYVEVMNGLFCCIVYTGALNGLSYWGVTDV